MLNSVITLLFSSFFFFLFFPIISLITLPIFLFHSIYHYLTFPNISFLSIISCPFFYFFFLSFHIISIFSTTPNCRPIKSIIILIIIQHFITSKFFLLYNNVLLQSIRFVKSKKYAVKSKK